MPPHVEGRGWGVDISCSFSYCQREYFVFTIHIFYFGNRVFLCVHKCINEYIYIYLNRYVCFGDICPKINKLLEVIKTIEWL
jgi:hypothetical protein